MRHRNVLWSTLRVLCSMVVLSVVLIFPQDSLAATGINRTINFQGKLVGNTGLNVADSSYSVVFTLYNQSSGGAALWTETQSVTTSDGIFRVALGSSTPFPANFNFNWDGIYLGIKVGADAEMTPRIRLASVPYAFNSERVAGLTVQDENGNASTSGTLKVPNGKVISFGDAFTTTAGNALTLTTTGVTGVTLPTTGTLASLDGVEVLTNKTIGSTGLTFSGAGTDITTTLNEDLTIVPSGTGNVGIGTTTPVGKFNVSGATVGKALVSFNETGNQDIFTASASGTTRFVIGNDGTVKLDSGQYANCRLTTNASGNVTCGSAAGGTSRYIVKGADENVPSGTTLQNDNDLTFSVGANETWSVYYVLRVTNLNSATPDWKTAILGSAGWTCSINMWGRVGTAIDPPSTLGTDCDNAPTAIVDASIAADASVPFTIFLQGTVTTTSAGAITLQWAPNTSGSLTVQAGSYVMAQKVGGTDGAGTVTVRQSDAGVSVGNVTTLEFGPASTSTDEFIVTDETAGISRVRIGNQVGMLNQAETVTGGWTFNTATTTFTSGVLANGGLNTTANTNLSLAANGSGQIVLSSDDNTGVYIGSAANAPAPLSVSGGIGGNAAFILNQLNGGNIFAASASGTTRFVINNAGNVGIGTTTPGQELDVNGDVLVGAGSTVDTRAAGTLGIGIATQTGLTLGRTGTTSTLNGDASSVINFGNFDVATNGNITVAAGVGIDTNASGILTVGNTTATTVNIGTTAATTLALGAGGSLTRAINIGTGTGVDTISIGTGGTGADSISIGNGAAANVISIGSATGAAQTTINAGTNDLTLASTDQVFLQSSKAAGGTTTEALNIRSTIDLGTADELLQIGDSGATFLTVLGGGNVGIGVTNPGGLLQLAAGTNTKAPLVFTAGTNLLSAVAGAMEWDGTNLYITQTSGPTRKTLAFTDSALTGSLGFDKLTGATNTTAAMVVGTGGSITISGSGTINSTSLLGSTWAAPAAIGSGTPAAGSFTTLSTGTTPAAAGVLRLPNNSNITARNAANSADINLIKVDASNLVAFGANTAAFTLGGAITGNGQNITGLGALDLGTNNLSLSGTTISTSGNNNNLTLTPNGSGHTVLSSDFNTGVLIGAGNNTAAPLSVSGGIGSNALAILNQTNSGDILAASASGATRFAIGNDGAVRLDSSQYANCRLTTDASGSVTCGSGAGGTSRYVVKGTNENVPSGTALQSDDELTFSVGANETWSVYYVLRVTNLNSATPDWKTAILGASGWTCSINMWGRVGTAIDPPSTLGTDCDNAPTALVDASIVADGNVPYTIFLQGTVTTSSAGSITLQWAPNTSGSLTVQAGSYVMAQKVGGTDGAGTMTIRQSDAGVSVGNVTTLEFGPATTSTDEFVISDETAGISRVRIGNQVGMLNQAEVVSGGWTFGTSATTFTSGINANGGLIVANGQTFDANGQVDLGDGGDAVTVNGSSLILQTTGAGSDITLNAVDQIILTDFANCSALETVSGVLTCGTDDGGLQTPWTSDIDADGFDLNDLSNILFRETTGAPAGTNVSAFRDNAGDLNFNVLTGKSLNVQVNGTDEYNFSSTGIAFNSNNITGLGTGITATAGLTIATTGANDLTLDSGTTGSIFLGNGASAKAITIGNTTTTTGLTFSSGGSGTGFTFNLSSGTSDFIITGVDADSRIQFSGLNGCDTIDTDGSGNLQCGTDSGAGSSPFGVAGGLITKSTGTDQVLFTMAQAGDYGLRVNTSTAPTVDLMQLDNSTNGVTTTGVDAFQIDYATAGSTASADNAGLRINVTSNNSGATTNLAGIYIGNLASAEANSTETGLRIGTGWDVGLSVESGAIVTSNLGLDITDSDTNPTCASGEYKIYADTSETRLKKCENGTVTDLEKDTSVHVVKGSNENVASGTTLQADNDLVFSAASGETWAFQYVLRVTNINSATPDWKAAILGASGWTCSYTQYIRIGATLDGQTNGTDCDNAPTAVADASVVADANVPFTVYLQGVITTSSSGSVTLQWAPNTSGSLTVMAGSYVIAQKVGGADLAEMYYSHDTLSPGEVVSIDPSLSAGIKRSIKPYDSQVLGVVSTQPGLLLGESGVSEGKPAFLALSGRVPVQVTSENGPIHAGDYLTSSSTPGKAMKATRPGTVIGQALSDFTDEGEGTVTLFIKNQWSGLFDGITEGQGLILSSGSMDGLIPSDNSSSFGASSPWVTTASGSGQVILPGTGGKEAVVFDALGNGTFSGTIRAKDFVIEDGKERTVASLSALLDQLWLRQEVLSSMNVEGSATVSGSLRVKDSTLFEGVVSVIQDFTAHNILVSGIATFLDKVVFHEDVLFRGHVAFHQDTAGYVKIAKDQTTVTITFDKPYEEIPVIQVSLSADTADIRDASDSARILFNAQYQYVVSEKSEKGFTILLNKPAEDDLDFSWTAIAVRNISTSTSESLPNRTDGGPPGGD